MDKETVYWHLPGICYFGMINHVLFDIMRRQPELFMEGYKVGSVYGTFPSAIWNGGRNFLAGTSDRQEVEKIIKSYNAFGIPVRFTWTNVLLEDKHLSDEYCNMIMKVGDNGLNQVLVNSPILEDYIRKNYPKYKVISSTTKRILSLDRLREEVDKDYFLVVLDYDFNHDEKVIDALKPVADRIEILVNETCQPHCPLRVSHYKEISKAQLEHNTKIQFPCSDPAPDKRTFKGCMNRPSFMSNADVADYVKMGYKNFKIVGRGEGAAFYIDSLIYYLVKDEHKDYVRGYLMTVLNKMGAVVNSDKEARRDSDKRKR